ncbi:hypothetical protein [Flavobacterium sp.]|uniref:hypothetical protein n=1 Tax=Flavobacterium sp. TaxID=239 RepID=UPI0037BF0499
MKLINQYDFQMKHPISQKTPIVLSVFKLENKIQIIEMFFDINEKSYICIANSISVEDFVLEKKELFRFTREEIKILGSISLIQNYYQNSNLKSLINGSFGPPEESPFFSFDFSFSGNSEKNSSTDGNSKIALIVNKEKSTFAIALNFSRKGDEPKLKMYLFDKLLNKIIDKDFNKDTNDRKCFLQNIDISEDGNALYLLSKSYSKEMNDKETGGKYQFEMTKFTQDKVESQIFDTKEHYIGSLKTIIKDEKLICIGFYSDEYDKRYKGVSYFELNPSSLAVNKSKFNPFSEQFILDKYGKINNKELKYLTFKNLLTTDNNELIFNAEESYVTQTAGFYNPYSGYSGGETFYNYDDVVSVKINEEGNLLWSRNINKRQTGGEIDPYVSYTSTLINNKVYFFINASEKIKDLENNRIEFRNTRKNKYNLNVIRINQNGDFDYQEILDDEENEVPFMVSNGIKSGNSVFFLGRKGTKKQLLKVSL